MNIHLQQGSLAGRYLVHHAVSGQHQLSSTDSWAEALNAYKMLRMDPGVVRASVTDTEFDREEALYLYLRDADRQEQVTPRMRRQLAERLEHAPEWRTIV